jgi:hypothetical protein
LYGIKITCFQKLDTDRDAAEVTWGNDHTNVYRLGFEGLVDLKLESPGSAKISSQHYCVVFKKNILKKNNNQ